MNLGLKVINNRASKFFNGVLILLFILIFTEHIAAQKATKDTLSVTSASAHSPRIATIASAVVPGLGQAYNKKFWKIPIIYLGLGSLIYYYNQNNEIYTRFRNAYRNKETVAVTGGEIAGEDLLYYRNKYRRYRDLNIIGVAVIYVLNIVDANVDANLYDFDVSDNLSFRVEPCIQNFSNKEILGVKCKINF